VTARVALRAPAILTVSFLALPIAHAAGTGGRAFARPDDAVRALVDTVKAGDVDALLALFGPEGRELVDTSDPATGRRNREVFLAAAAEGWTLADKGPDLKELVVGNEAWPFPMPLVKTAAGWSFDAAAGREEILNRRIGNNELAVIRILGEYVAAQRAYAAASHDGKRAGLYARRFGSSPGKQDGLYWPSRRGEPRSPLGVLVAKASEEGYRRRRDEQGPTPFHGYYFRILEGQGKSAKGGTAEYVVNGEMSGGFGLVAWPVHYDASGVMTFVVNQDGVAHEKDLGPKTATLAKSITRYDPDPTWHAVKQDVDVRATTN
jgi:hypothetical protein